MTTDVGGADEKYCPRCETSVPSSGWYTAPGSQKTWCKACWNTYNRLRKDPEKAKQNYLKNRDVRNPITNAKTRALSWQMKCDTIRVYGGRCACCGEERMEFLALDHIDGGGSQERAKRRAAKKAASGLAFYRDLRKAGYPDGLRALCHNCNVSIGHYGYCPHQRAKTIV